MVHWRTEQWNGFLRKGQRFDEVLCCWRHARGLLRYGKARSLDRYKCKIAWDSWADIIHHSQIQTEGIESRHESPSSAITQVQKCTRHDKYDHSYSTYIDSCPVIRLQCTSRSFHAFSTRPSPLNLASSSSTLGPAPSPFWSIEYTPLSLFPPVPVEPIHQLMAALHLHLDQNTFGRT